MLHRWGGCAAAGATWAVLLCVLVVLMNGPRLLPGAPVPLFERLVDSAPGDSSPMPPLDRDGLILSIAAEISDLFNSRLPRPRSAVEGRDRTVLDYGIADISTFQPFSSTQETALVAELTAAIAAFEPRLIDARVQLHRLDSARREAFLQDWSERSGRLAPNHQLRRLGAWFTILPESHDRQSLLVEISGSIRLEDRIEPVHFPVIIRDGTGGSHAA